MLVIYAESLGSLDPLSTGTFPLLVNRAVTRRAAQERVSSQRQDSVPQQPLSDALSPPAKRFSQREIHSFSNAWLVNLSVWLFSVTVRTVCSLAPFGNRASVSRVTETSAPG